MSTKPKPAHALLPGFLVAACAALPGGSAAQSTTPAKGTGTLSTAMAEARRSPFHATTGTGELAIVQPSGIPISRAGDRQVRDAARGPSFNRGVLADAWRRRSVPRGGPASDLWRLLRQQS